MRTAALALAVVASAVLGGCSDPAPDPLTIAWTEHALPAPDGAPGRSIVRDAVQCGAGWWVVGAVFLDSPTEDQDTRPAVWFSPDRSTWTSVPVDAATYWGSRAILDSVACARDRIAVVGARSGGAHGNPRVTTFRMRGSTLVDVAASFVQYGGVTASNVGPIAGGPTGWLITGNRISGPGVWFTDDPREFTRVEAEPGLTDDGDLSSLAQGAGWSGEEWVLVGSGARTGRHLDPDPLAWTSPDGLSWTPEEMPAADGVEDAERVTLLDDGRLLVVGLSGDGFASWLRDGTGWKPAVTFGAVADEWQGSPYVASAVTTSIGALATLSTGSRYELWRSDGVAWSKVEVPLEPQTAGDHSLMVAAGGDLLLVGDAGDGGHVWSGERVSP